MSATAPVRKRLTGPMSARCRQARIDAGLTQQQLADMTGMSLKTVNNYENSAYARARKRPNIAAWATATDRQIEEIWGRNHQGIARTGWFSETADGMPLAI